MKKEVKMQQSGGNFYAYLPKGWIELLGLKKGTSVILDLDVTRKEIIIKVPRGV